MTWNGHLKWLCVCEQHTCLVWDHIYRTLFPWQWILEWIPHIEQRPGNDHIIVQGHEKQTWEKRAAWKRLCRCVILNQKKKSENSHCYYLYWFCYRKTNTDNLKYCVRYQHCGTSAIWSYWQSDTVIIQTHIYKSTQEIPLYSHTERKCSHSSHTDTEYISTCMYRLQLF